VGNLKEARKKKKMSLEELAKKIGVTEGAISRYETGDRNMSVETARKIADVLKVKWWKLYD